ncbi:EAL domain-containing protein [Actinotalea ferrariae]|uniref:EAL domain-containing protein n=1 Tax=Actinotalea ferrariae TaxID=1386098 RepID=UPI001C8B18E7|nr:EAL domain-containing protein [Actinotalea ferrariae]MBX9246551.1 EAL domain-containing protein [Actinotalea ferrariae]
MTTLETATTTRATTPSSPADGAPAAAQLALGLLARRPDSLETELQKALGGGQLRMHYQPQVDMRTSTVVAMEALIRWAHPDHGLLTPAQFLPLAQSAGLMGMIDSWALRTACRDGAWLAARGYRVEVAVNVTASQLTDARFITEVETATRAANLPLELLTVEMGLRDVLGHIYSARDVALALRRRGVRVSVSDIGTGASSPERLSQLQVGEVKVDRGLTAGLDDATFGSAEAVRQVVAAGQAAGARVVAEGIETPAQYEAARAAGCDRAQGYLLGRPAPLDDLAGLLARLH